MVQIVPTSSMAQPSIIAVTLEGTSRCDSNAPVPSGFSTAPETNRFHRLLTFWKCWFFFLYMHFLYTYFFFLKICIWILKTDHFTVHTFQLRNSSVKRRNFSRKLKVPCRAPGIDNGSRWTRVQANRCAHHRSCDTHRIQEAWFGGSENKVNQWEWWHFGKFLLFCCS